MRNFKKLQLFVLPVDQRNSASKPEAGDSPGKLEPQWEHAGEAGATEEDYHGSTVGERERNIVASFLLQSISGIFHWLNLAGSV